MARGVHQRLWRVQRAREKNGLKGVHFTRPLHSLWCTPRLVKGVVVSTLLGSPTKATKGSYHETLSRMVVCTMVCEGSLGGAPPLFFENFHSLGLGFHFQLTGPYNMLFIYLLYLWSLGDLCLMSTIFWYSYYTFCLLQIKVWVLTVDWLHVELM